MLHKDTFEVCTLCMTETSMFDNACEHFTPPTNGDKIRQMSDEELAEKLVYCKHVQKIIGEMGYSYVSFASTIIKNEEFETKPEAIAATVKELKKEYKEDDRGRN